MLCFYARHDCSTTADNVIATTTDGRIEGTGLNRIVRASDNGRGSRIGLDRIQKPTPDAGVGRTRLNRITASATNRRVFQIGVNRVKTATTDGG